MELVTIWFALLAVLWIGYLFLEGFDLGVGMLMKLFARGEAERRVLGLLDWAAECGGGFSILWHPERFDRPSARGWDRLYFELVDAVRERGGICLAAGELAGLAAERFGLPRD